MSLRHDFDRLYFPDLHPLRYNSARLYPITGLIIPEFH